MELILNAQGKSYSQLNNQAFEEAEINCENLFFSGMRKWSEFLNDFDAFSALHFTYCWLKKGKNISFYLLEFDKDTASQENVLLRFKEIPTQGDSSSITGLVKKMLKQFPGMSAIVDLNRNVHENNRLFNMEAWSAAQTHEDNIDKWRQACIDVLTTGENQNILFYENEMAVQLSLISDEDIQSPLFLIHVQKIAKPTQSFLSYSGNSKTSENIDIDSHCKLPAGFIDNETTALTNQLKFHEIVLNAIPADIAVFDENHKYVFVNKQAVHDPEMRAWMIGKTDYDYCKKKGLDFKLAEERTLNFNKAVATKEAFEFITEHVHSESNKYVLRKFQPYFEDGQLTRVIGYGIDVTRIVKAEMKSKENEHFGRRLLNEIESNILVVKNDLSVVYLNSKAKELLEIEEGDITEITLERYLSEANQAVLKSCLESCMSIDQESKALRFAINTQESEVVKEVEVHIHPFDFEQKPCFFLTMNDITNFIVEVEKREEAEELAKTIINTALDAVITADEEGEIVAWSDKAIEMFGYKEQEVIGKKLSEVIIPEKLKSYHEAGMDKMKAISESDFAGRLIRLKVMNKQGKEFPVELFVNQINVKSKRLFSAFIRDVSEQVKAEQIIIQSERQLSFLLSSIPSVPYVAKLISEFQFTFLHARIFELTGFEPNDFLDQRINWKNRIHPKDLKHVLIALKALREKGEVIIEYRFLHANENYIWIRNSIKVNQNEYSEADSLTGVFEDITDSRIKDAVNNQIQMTEIEILQLDWKDFDEVNEFCAIVIKKINRTLDFLKAEIWDYIPEKNIFSCIASASGKEHSGNYLQADEPFIEKLFKETSFVFDSNAQMEYLSGNEVPNCLVAGIKRDGLVKGFLVFSATNKKEQWSSQLKHFIKSIADRLSLVAESFLRRSSQDKLSKALFNGKMSVFDWHKDTDYIEWTEGLYNIELNDEAPAHLEDLTSLVFREDKKILKDAFNQASLLEENISCSFRLINHGGQMRYFDLSLTLLGQKDRVLGFLKDVSSKTIAEKELQRLNDGANQLNSVIAALQNLTDEGLIRKRFSSSIVNSLNIADCFFMKKSAEGYGRLDELEDTSENSSKLQEQLISSTTEILDASWINGQPVMHKITVPLTGDRPIQFIAVPFAVSDKVESLIIAYCTEFEEQSEARADFMMKCVEVLKQRLLKLRSEVALKKINKELITSNHQLEQYSYIIAHNLRAPFSNIKGILELLNLESISDKQDQLLFLKLTETVENIDRILLDLNKLLTIKNALEIKYEEIQLDELLDSVLKTMEHDFQAIRAKVEIDLEKNTEIIACRPYIISVFQNLLSNSYKYRNVENGLLIQIKALKDEAGNTIIIFKDNGIGIDLKRYNDRVFQLYSRFHRHVQGSGLGLYLVKSQIKAMGGEIEIESAPGKGTTFYITIKN